MKGLGGFLLVAAIIGALVFFGGNRFSDDLTSDELMQLTYLGIMGSFVGWGFFSGGWRNVRRDLRSLLFWIAALLVLTGLYSFKNEFRTILARIGGGLVPGMAVERAPGEYVFTRSNDGMFFVDAKVNGHGVRFMFDTGASSVALTAEDARAAGIAVSDRDFSIEVRTANGITKVAPVVLDTLTIGQVTLERVRASVSRPGAMSRSLLGHSFLDRLNSYEVRGDQLILRMK